ncbi:TetR/AcrR family transcriptional regulator [Metasolibacillus meyeri]|uniref:TetR/AcrR family transcriptional regulator n=1 Tax=Metasolibacillus meyeri TaxID=1071052 RepID=A0AAW9NQN5_9BACL|nr:TetR/AcrR family transcriptional regulator [Metasolibacillus meyeri]MEC1178662.1 TetR/AcrR family transcriptional regulator [Metasolibacillus meyeri]
MNSRQQQKEQRRQLILQTALDLFIRKGYGETKIADIAKAANMSMGLLFHYFESKEKLYEALIRIGSEKLKMELNFGTASPLTTFQYIAEDIFQTIRANPFAAKMFVLMENAQHLDTLPADIKEMLVEADKLITKSISLIEEGQRLNEIRDGNPQALAIAFWNSLQGIAQHIALHPEVPCPEAEWIIAILKK